MANGLEIAGISWKFAGKGWQWLKFCGLAGNWWKLLEMAWMAENCWNLQKKEAVNCWKLLEIARHCWNGWCWLDTAGNGWKCPKCIKISGNCQNWQQGLENYWKRIKIAGYVCNWLELLNMAKKLSVQSFRKALSQFLRCLVLLIINNRSIITFALTLSSCGYHRILWLL